MQARHQDCPKLKFYLHNMSNYSRILIGPFDLLEDRCIDGDIKNIYYFFRDSMLLCDCSVIDHRRR